MDAFGAYCGAIQAGTRFESRCNRMQSPYGCFGTRRTLVWASDLFPSAFECVQSIETAIETYRLVRIRIGLLGGNFDLSIYYIVFFPCGQEGTFLNRGFTGGLVAKRREAWYNGGKAEVFRQKRS